MLKTHALRAIIFDLDGTLVDSAEDIRAAVNSLFAEIGLRPITAVEIRAMIGDGVPKLIERALAAAHAMPMDNLDLVRRFLEIYQPNPARFTRPYPGVVETLTELKRRGVQLALVTNKPVIATKKILGALSMSGFFPVVVGGDSVPFRKPHPAPILEAVKRLGVQVDRCMMVGDNFHDVEAAHAAGMRCTAVTYGYHHRSPTEFGAEHLVDRFDQLLGLVQTILPHNETINNAVPTGAASSTSSKQESYP
ncbi:phosphoglycolate phosphatase [Bradyrhizobium sp. LTSP857]|uniref:phosphoglycolate phosphatase n=1 Tax=Bradyrhizobium sp. LTSP857 TaxID=1619231 RepID=UPI0007C7126F|nr:phosphoglycolate phosphatase [Bradyrhizobium sp. LTSP857]